METSLDPYFRDKMKILYLGSFLIANPDLGIQPASPRIENLSLTGHSRDLLACVLFDPVQA